MLVLNWQIDNTCSLIIWATVTDAMVYLYG